MTAQVQKAGMVLGLGSVTSAAAIATRQITHSMTLALGVAALVAVTTLVGIIVAIRTERSKEVAEASERRRLAKRATAGGPLSWLIPKHTAEMRQAALGYRVALSMHPAEHEHAAAEHEDKHEPPDDAQDAPSIPPQRTNGAKPPSGGTGSSPA